MNASSVWQLTKLDLFSEVGEDELCTALGNGASVKKLPRRRAVPLDEGTGWVYGLADGIAKLCRPPVSGRRNVEGLLRSGDLFGRLGGEGPRQALVIETITACTLVTLPAPGLRKYLTSRPDLMLTVLQILEDSQRRLQRRIEALVFKDVYTRVTETVLQLAVDVPESCPFGMAVDIRINQSDLADLVGSSRQAVNRVLRDLERRDLLHRHGKVYCIPDLRRIRQKLDSETLAVEG